MKFEKHLPQHCFIKCPVCKIILGEKTPGSMKSFYCRDCHTTHWFASYPMPYKSIPDAHKPTKCKCAQCRDRT